jgi:hypothetical protein
LGLARGLRLGRRLRPCGVFTINFGFGRNVPASALKVGSAAEGEDEPCAGVVQVALR